MCGRFTLAIDPAEIRDTFPEFFFPAQLAPRFNIAPSQPILALPNDGKNKADFFTWGLIPSWAKDIKIGNRLINARAETIQEKPSFRSAFKYRRCLIFADGYYEWEAHPGSSIKTPHYISLISGKPFAFAGLWEHWQSPDGSEVKSATIITTTPNKLMSPIHNRMPVILPPEAYSKWLGPTPLSANEILELLLPYPSEFMKERVVSSLVNNPANDIPNVLAPV